MWKLNLHSPNYCATVVEIKNIVPLEWCDNVVSVPFFWYSAIVSKDVKIWDIWIVFTAEVQLSEKYCEFNNLYRDAALNADVNLKWYMEPKRRVKAIKFRWHKSSALFMPLSSISYVWKIDFKVWDSFNEIDGIEICKKYEIPVRQSWTKNHLRWKTKVFERIDNKHFPEHIDSSQYLRNSHLYKDNDYINVSQKIHGTSVRLWLVKVKRPLKWYEKLLSKLWVSINDTEYDYIWASRRVIKNWNIINGQTWYYKTDVWKVALDKYKESFVKDYIFYWEIIWRTWDQAIQKWYTYNLKQWECELYIYRVAIVNEDWVSVDLTFNQMVELCNLVWLKVVPVLREWYHKDFTPSDWLDKRFYDMWYSNAVPLSDENSVDEWIVIRKEWICPYVTKLKSTLFYEYETKLLDDGIIDLESNQWEDEES